MYFSRLWWHLVKYLQVLMAFKIPSNRNWLLLIFALKIHWYVWIHNYAIVERTNALIAFLCVGFFFVCRSHKLQLFFASWQNIHDHCKQLLPKWKYSNNTSWTQQQITRALTRYCDEIMKIRCYSHNSVLAWAMKAATRILAIKGSNLRRTFDTMKEFW